MKIEDNLGEPIKQAKVHFPQPFDKGFSPQWLPFIRAPLHVSAICPFVQDSTNQDDQPDQSYLWQAQLRVTTAYGHSLDPDRVAQLVGRSPSKGLRFDSRRGQGPAVGAKR